MSCNVVSTTSPGDRPKPETELALAKTAISPRRRVSQDNWFSTPKITCLCTCWHVILHNSSLLQGLTYSCPTRFHRLSPRDHKPLLSKLYAWARHQCGVTGLPHSFWVLGCCFKASSLSHCHAHDSICSHSPVKVLNQWKKEVPSNRIELVWAGSQFHLRLTLFKRKMKSRHKMQHLTLHITAETTGSLQPSCCQSLPARTSTATSFESGWITSHFRSSHTSKYFSTI